jgi:hypothetical protein
MKDVEIVSRLLAEKGLDRKPTLERAILNQANSFAATSADRVDLECDSDGMLKYK